jgi:ParB family transcriptional regulator, chromosome partitioning protein
MQNRALGKGLSALIPEQTEKMKGQTIAYLKTDLIADNKLQPRQHYNDDKLTDLKNSIKEKGVLQPILVRRKGDGYEVIAGERRLKAAKALKLEEIPVIIKDVNDNEALVLALIENIQREELNPIEEAKAYKKLIDEFHYSQEVIADSVGKDRSTISNMLRLLKLPKEIQQALFDGIISMGHARALLGLEDTEEQSACFLAAIKKDLSVREIEKLIQVKTQNSTKKTKTTVKYPQLAALAEALQLFLGTKVRVIPNNKRGKIVVEYYSLEDLERIIQIIKGTK